MRFFIQYILNLFLQPAENGKTIPNKKFKDDELTSSESDYDDKEDAEIESEEEEETAQEKRLRLAKIYLQEIEKEGSTFL